MKITITAKSVAELDSFVPVAGTWTIDGNGDSVSITDVEASVANCIGSRHAISVQVFHSDGRSITSDVPASGTFVCSRK